MNSKHLLMALVAILINLPNAMFGQGFTILDTIKYEVWTLELVITSTDELGVNPKKENYVKMVSKAMKQGLTLCPQDSTFLYEVSKMVRLDPDAHKFNAFVATAPYTKKGEYREFFIPSIVSLQSGENAVELYYETVGFFHPEESLDPFPPLRDVNMLGYLCLDTGFIPYDWIFVREVQTTTP